MVKCYICNENELEGKFITEEHIIPDFIGGKLKSKNIICSECNQKLGAIADIGFFDLDFFTNILNPNAEKSKGRDFQYICNGKEVIRRKNGELISSDKDLIRIEKCENNSFKATINFLYSDNQELNNFNEKIIKAINKKAGRNNIKIKEEKITEILNNLKDNTQTIEHPCLTTSFQINSDRKLGLGIIKIALHFYFLTKKETSNITELLKIFSNIILKKSNNINDISKYLYPYIENDIILKDSIYHQIILKGDSINKKLFCIVSIYGVCNYIVLLNNNYSGEDFQNQYIYNLRNQKELTKKFEKRNLKSIKSDLNQMDVNIHDLSTNFLNFFVVPNAQKLTSENLLFISEITLEKFIVENKNKLISITANNFNFQFKNKLLDRLKIDKTFKVLLDKELEKLYTIIKKYLLERFYQKIVGLIITEICINNSKNLDTFEIFLNKLEEEIYAINFANKNLKKFIKLILKEQNIINVLRTGYNFFHNVRFQNQNLQYRALSK